MRIWLLKTGEPLPCDPGSPRLLRSGTVAEILADRGHNVLWWSSTFNQVNRTSRFDKDTCLRVRERFDLWLLHHRGYTKNVSLDRIRYNRGTARAFERLAESEISPDLILCSMPTIESALAATAYGMRHDVPVILDCRDMWPDIILDRFPRWSHPVTQFGIRTMVRDLRTAARRADAITGITDDFVDWGLGYADRPRSEWDQAFPLAYSGKTPPSAELSVAQKFWNRYEIGRDGEFTICFFGNLSPRYELPTVVRAARILKSKQANCRFIICGDGEALPELKKQSQGLHNVEFPGWLGAPEIWSLMRRAQVGIVPYPSTRDYRISIPNKAIEYLSAGLPIVTSLSGSLETLLERQQCGVHYANGDADGLASWIIELMQSPERVEAMSVRALEVFEQNFVGERIYGQMCEYLEQVVEQFHGSPRRLRFAA